VLAAMAQAITERSGKLKNPDYALAVSLAQRASELSQGKNLTYLALVAEAYYRDQKYDNAIATLEQVVGLIDKDSVLDANPPGPAIPRSDRPVRAREQVKTRKPNSR
jgi:hypothetical protein